MKTPRLLSVLALIAVIVVAMAAVGMAKDKAENKYKPAAIEGAEYTGSSASARSCSGSNTAGVRATTTSRRTTTFTE
jgi:hypothetical protein